MREPFRQRAAILTLAILPLLLTACGGGYGRPEEPGSQLAFGVDMARRGLWSEALFRFHQAERLDPNNPRVYNNLAVAYEATGDFDKALEYYQRALRASPENRELRANYTRFVEFYQGFKPQEQKEGAAAAQPSGGTPTVGTPTAPQEPEATPPVIPPVPPPGTTGAPVATPEAIPEEPPAPPPPAVQPPPS
ncbi:MAG TPA: tetratricopeptide repeat protein [Thermoanaerobaculia bacterium]|nr:tetratricopeptide repeat protein [Thermoanaerobaculia bacterium]